MKIKEALVFVNGNVKIGISLQEHVNPLNAKTYERVVSYLANTPEERADFLDIDWYLAEYYAKHAQCFIEAQEAFELPAYAIWCAAVNLMCAAKNFTIEVNENA